MRYYVDDFKGLEYCTDDELVSKNDMIDKGFKVIEFKGNVSKKTGGNNTDYFIHPNLPYVYAECYFGKVDRYAQLIIDKNMFYKEGLKDKAVVLKDGGGHGNRCVPAVSRNATIVPLHRLMGIKVDVDHIWCTLNIIIPANLRPASPLLNNKHKQQADAIKVLRTGMFRVEFEENKKLFATNELESLREMGYEVTVGGKVSIHKDFYSKKEALIAIKEYEDRFYKRYAYSVINDMRSRFDLKFQQLILGTVTEDDVKKTILREYANDAYYVYRYNLIPLCIKYGIPYNNGRTLANGNLVNL